MKPQYYTMIGLGVDLVGALLVAVEAIKIENFRSFRDRLLMKAHSYTLSPRIVFMCENGKRKIVNPEEERPAESYPGVFQALHYVAGLIVLFMANGLLDGLLVTAYRDAVAWVFNLNWYFLIPIVLVSIPLLVFGVFWNLGEVAHIAITGTLVRTMKAIDFIEANTPSGTVGILGFALLAIGFSLQFIGTFLSL